jgi:hypothetical protein
VTGPSITLDNLYEGFFEVFPDLRERYEQDADLYEDDEGRNSDAFLGAFLDNRVLLPELRAQQHAPEPDERLVRAFGFLELLLTEGDDDVQNAAQATVCEAVALDRPEVYERAKPYLGPVTRKTCDDLIANFSAAADRHRAEQRWWRRRRP